MARNINNFVFDEATKLKLTIFGECFKEWLPVFLYDKYTPRVYIYDFFAGSGTDRNNLQGSPLILLNEAKGEERKYCKKAEKRVIFTFNEGNRNKSLQLQQNVENFIENCRQQNKCGDCVYDYEVTNSDFQSLFQENKIQNILRNSRFGKFILLDQYGFKEIDDTIFNKLVNFPKTDFIFFISSSFIRRFKEHPNTRAYINTERIKFSESEPKHCHREIANYFRQLIPPGKEYYLHHFTIQKNKNYYGLIFGTNHTFGMEKFLKVCWRKDTLSGESNCNIDNDFLPGTLFYNKSSSNKRETIKANIEQRILNGELTDNITGLKYALQQGCEPKIFTETVRNLEKKGQIQRLGDVNNSSSRIHTIKRYNIKVCKNENN